MNEWYPELSLSEKWSARLDMGHHLVCASRSQYNVLLSDGICMFLVTPTYPVGMWDWAIETFNGIPEAGQAKAAVYDNVQPWPRPERALGAWANFIASAREPLTPSGLTWHNDRHELGAFVTPTQHIWLDEDVLDRCPITAQCAWFAVDQGAALVVHPEHGPITVIMPVVPEPDSDSEEDPIRRILRVMAPKAVMA